MNYKLLLTIAAIFLFAACSDDNNSDPNLDDRIKFLGSWTCDETIGSSQSAFTIVITTFGESDSLRVSNFSNLGNSSVALALVSGKSIVFPGQQVGVTNIDIQGSGLYLTQGANEKMNLNYSVDGQSALANCVKN